MSAATRSGSDAAGYGNGERSAPAAVTVDRSSKRVLVADDSETYRAIALRVLGDAGYPVVGSADGAEALRLLGEEGSGFSLLLLELDLPKLRGLDLIRRARDTPKLRSLPVLVVSEALSEHLKRVLGELGLDAFLSKNHPLRDLLYQVDAMLFPMEADQRKSPRRLEHLPVNYWVGDRLSLERCFDLSETGMFVVVADDEPPAAGTRLALRFWLPTGDRLVVCEGEVVWRNSASGDLRVSHPPGMGVRFTRLAPADLELVREFLGRKR